MHQTNLVLRIAWNRGLRLEGVRCHVRATSTHPRLGEVVLVSITLMLVGLLLATVRHALEVSNGQIIQVAPPPVLAWLQ